MTIGTVVTGLVLIGVVGLIVRKMIRDKKSGKASACGCGCSGCSGHCH